MFRSSGDIEERSLLIVACAGAAMGLDASTGEVRWQLDLRERLGYGAVDLAIQGQRIVLAARSGALLCLDYATGSILWEGRTTRLQGRTTLVLEGSRTFVSRESVVDCFNSAGQKVWTRQVPATGVLSLGFPGNFALGDPD